LTFIAFSCIKSYDFSEVTKILQDNLVTNFNGSVGFLVMNAEGTVLYKNYLNSGSTVYSDNTILHIASACKWLAMSTVMTLAD